MRALLTAGLTILGVAATRTAHAAGPPPAVAARWELALQSRRLGYRDDIYRDLRPYEAELMPTARLALELYPLARTTPAWAHLGFGGRYEHAFLTSSERLSTGERLSTRADAWAVGVRARSEIGAHRLVLGVDAFRDRFLVSRTPGRPERVPSVDYSGVEFGARLELAASDGLRVWPSLAGFVAPRLGDVGGDRWFPDAAGRGFHLGLRVAWRARAGVEPYLGFDWRRTVLDLDPVPGTGVVAGGAADDRVSFGFGLALSGLAGEP